MKLEILYSILTLFCYSLILFDSSDHELAVEHDPTTLCYVVKMLSQQVKPEEVRIPLRRGFVLDDAIRSVKRSGFPVDHTVMVSTGGR